MGDHDYNEIDLKLMNSFLQFNSLYRFSNAHNMRTCAKADCGKRHLKLRYSQFLLLFYISDALSIKPDGVSASELSTKMNVKPPTINPLISDLEDCGLIERRTDETDRRYVRIKMTPDGVRFIEQHKNMLTEKIHGLAVYLGKEKSTELVELLTDVYTYCKSLQDKKLAHSDDGNL